MTPEMQKLLSDLATAIETHSGRGFRPIGQVVAQINRAVGSAPAEFVGVEVEEVEGSGGKFAGSIVVFTADLVAVVKFASVPAAGWAADREVGGLEIAVQSRADLRSMRVVSGSGPRIQEYDAEHFAWGSTLHLEYDGLGAVRLNDQRASLDELYPSLLADLVGR